MVLALFLGILWVEAVRAEDSAARAVKLWESAPKVVDSKVAMPGVPCDPNLKAPDCLRMTREFCGGLYDGTHRGNLDLGDPAHPIRIRLGTSADNDFSHSYLAYADAKAQARDRLPADVRSALERGKYFEGLGTFLKSKPLKDRTIEEQVQTQKLGDDLASTWNNALDEAWRRRMEVLVPGFSKVPRPMRPPAVRKLQDDEWRKLKAAVNVAIWGEHPRWKRTVSDFVRLQAEYVAMIQENPKLSKETKDAWISRIQAIRLRVPGSDPKDQDSATDACASTEVNAAYSPDDNTLTVCAGKFNSQERALVSLGHEMGHALDPGTTVLAHEAGSSVAQSLNGVWISLCEGPAPQCPKEWAAAKKGFDAGLAALGSFKFPPEAEPLMACLLTKKLKKKAPTKTYFKEAAEERASGTIGGLADNRVFLELTLPETPIPDGSMHPNPWHLKPFCHQRNDRHELAGEAYAAVIFSAELSCSDPKRPRDERMAEALDRTQEMIEKAAVATLPLGGRFSESDEMIEGGYSQNVGESFSDAIGLKAVARVLSKDAEYVQLEDRRNAYFASIANYCEAPSMVSKNPAEAQVEKDHALEEHPLQDLRMRRFLIPSVRDTLGCTLLSEKDRKNACDPI